MTDEENAAAVAGPGPASRKHEFLVKSINKHCDFIESAQLNDLDYTRSNVRYEQLSEKWKEFENLHWQMIDIIDQAQVELHQAVYSSTEEKYMEALSVLTIHINSVRPANLVPELMQPNPETSARPLTFEVKMPPREIKNTWGKFEGDLTKWRGFRDRYMAEVHNKEEIEPSMKYMQLKKSLLGEAARVFGDGEPNEATYNEAWLRLNRIFDRKYLICREHVHELFRLPVLTGQATAAELRNMTTVAAEQIRQLRAHEIPVDAWDMIICVILHDRLANDIGREWDLHRTSETPTAKEMIEFLDVRADSLTGIESLNTDRNLQVSVQNERASRSANRGRGQNNRTTSVGGQNNRATSVSGQNNRGQNYRGQTERQMYPCPECGSMNHQIYVCDQFLAKSFIAKKQCVVDYNLCPNCLKRRHPNNGDCWSTKCGDDRCRADPNHNSLICPNKQQKVWVPRRAHQIMMNDQPQEGAWALPTEMNMMDIHKRGG